MEITTREKRLICLVFDYAIKTNRSSIKYAGRDGDRALSALKTNNLILSHGIVVQDAIDALMISIWKMMIMWVTPIITII